ncbi:MAG TPA: phosphoadenylyl-sulfate reductase [Desulfuromonadales bacterium]|nr:phosphoadenylyl-sulfate reductase [Desulfuromonadales bacterium]
MTTKIPSLPENATATEILQAGLAAAGGPVKLACSFSVEDVVVIDLVRELNLPVGIFALDTGRLNEETYEVAEAVSERYGVSIDWYFPEREAVEKLEREKGLFSFRASLENRHECCRIRKVEPLGRALAGLAGWVTGMRREQSVTRADIAPLEIDAAHGGILKINPLVSWTEAEVWAYAEKKRIPLNRLHKLGYPSIGCAPCTRAIRAGEHPRAGRWWWEDPENKECGLHKR